MNFELDKIYNMDCVDVMKSLPNESIDLVVTDPPYKVTKRGCHGTMSGYWATDRANNGTIFSHNDIDIEEYLPRILPHTKSRYPLLYHVQQLELTTLL